MISSSFSHMQTCYYTFRLDLLEEYVRMHQSINQSNNQSVKQTRVNKQQTTNRKQQTINNKQQTNDKQTMNGRLNNRHPVSDSTANIGLIWACGLIWTDLDWTAPQHTVSTSKWIQLKWTSMDCSDLNWTMLHSTESGWSAMHSNAFNWARLGWSGLSCVQINSSGAEWAERLSQPDWTGQLCTAQYCIELDRTAVRALGWSGVNWKELDWAELRSTWFSWIE